MEYLSPIDAAFLRMESKRTPMHVGAMLTFKLPPDAPPDFVRDLMLKMREKPFMPPPFNCRLARGRRARLWPAWEPTEVDMDYHLRHSALPYPGGERELGVLVARLHSHPLDLSRPLWECHLIEGLENRRFALYFKAHHCAIDGMGAMRMVQNWLSSDPKHGETPGPWVLGTRPAPAAGAAPSLWERLKKPARSAAAQARATVDLVKALTAMIQGEDSSTRAALETPRSLFNMRVSQQRRLGTNILELPRLKTIADRTGTTVNDVMLAVVGGAIRRYLVEARTLPEKPLLASIPVALSRREGQTGTVATGFVVPVGTHLDDPRERLAIIHRVTTRGKDDLRRMPPDAQLQMALLGIAPLLLGQVTGTLPLMPPFFNFVVSNVVLSKGPLYLMGAELEAMYPVSFLFDGYALNITLVGYNNRIAVGFLGCREAIPSLQRLAVYTGEALTELELSVCGEPAAAPAPKKAQGNGQHPVGKAKGSRSKPQAAPPAM